MLRCAVLRCVVLQACAAEVGTDLQVAPSLSHFSHPDPSQHISVGLAGDHQVLNASLAVAIVRSWEQTHLKQLQQQDSSSNTAAASSGGDGSGSAAGSSIQATAEERLQQLQGGVLPLEYCEGLRKATWPGRSQVSATCP
jgi:folylpolyglutamate synthase/dihydropteroate synthase